MKTVLTTTIVLFAFVVPAFADPMLGGGGTPNQAAQPRGFGWDGGVTEDNGPAPGVAKDPKGNPDRAGNISHDGFFGPVGNGGEDN